MDAAYNAGLGELFDIGETRRALQARRAELLAECTANSKLQARFDQIAAQLHPNTLLGGAGGAGGVQGVPGQYQSPYQGQGGSGGAGGVGGAGGLGMAGQASMGGSLGHADSEGEAKEEKREGSRLARAEPVTKEQYESYTRGGSAESNSNSDEQ